MSDIVALITSLVPLVVAVASLVAAVTSLLALRQSKATHRLVNSEWAKAKVTVARAARAEGFTAGEAAERGRNE